MGNSFTARTASIAKSQTSFIIVNVELGPPTDLYQNANSWGGIPDHFGCTAKWYDSYGSLNIAGTTRTEIIWGDTCSIQAGEGGSMSGIAIAFIEQGHYVTAFIAGISYTSDLQWGSDTTLKNILANLTFVASKPTNEN